MTKTAAEASAPAGSKKMSIAEALREAIREEMARDERVFCLGEDIGIKGGFGGAFTVTLGLSDQFGHERILDTPISETGIAGAAVGAALMGMRPIADVQYADFLFCAMDQIVNQAAKMRYMSGGKVSVPMVLRAPTGATTRAAQHSQSPESFFIHVPGIKVACPSTAYDAKGLLKTAIRDDDPVLFFEHKLLYGSKGMRAEKGALSPVGEVPLEDYTVPFGRGAVRREGTDVTIVAKLLMVYKSLAAARMLEEEGISCEVIDPRTLVPFDTELVVESVRKTGRLIVVDECPRTGGWAGDVAALIQEKAFGSLNAPILRVTAPDTPPPFAPVMEKYFVPSEQKIVQAVREVRRMALIPLSQMLREARAGGYAVGYFEAWDTYSLEAVVEAAEAERSPVVIGFGGMMVDQDWISRFGIESLGAYGRVVAERAKVPTALILNEVRDAEHALRGIDSGYNVVMILSSDLPYEENVRQNALLVERAHARGVEVQGELGRLPNFGEDARMALTDPEQVREFVERTGVDFLAVSIGNEHLRTEGRACVDLDRLRAIRQKVAVPLVIHGGSGFPEEVVARVIPEGVALFHVGTIMKRCCLEATRGYLAGLSGALDWQALVGSRKGGDFMMPARQTIIRVVRAGMRLYGSSGKAA